jgi:protease I
MARVAFVVGEDFEDTEFRVPFDRVRQAGHEAVLVGAKAGQELHGKKGKETVRTEQAASQLDAKDFDAIVIPGGYSPDHLRMDAGVVSFVRAASQAKKPIAAVCHGPSLLIEADLVRGRTITSWPSIRRDLINAGATWVDERVVEDGGLITSRNPHDVDAFSQAIMKRLPS